MASTLTAALAWAARGFRVFPCIANTKKPLFEGWTESATTDEATIRGWWSSERVEHAYNPGVLTTDLVVLDADMKDGKNGLASFAKLDLEFDTLTVRTPTGGYHFYYCGADAANAVEMLPGLDVRGRNGYVMAPGSLIDGVPYVVDIDEPIAAIPEQVRTYLRTPLTRPAGGASAVELDSPSAMAAASYFLLHEAEPAVEGAGGDDTTYRVACRLRDLGLSEGAAAHVMLEVWNDRCYPPWDADELQAKVENAYAYATGVAGQAHPEYFFEGMAAIPPAPAVDLEPALDLSVFQFGNALTAATFRPRPWVMPSLLLKRSVTTLISPGGAGKSTFTLTIAAHVALGLPFLGFECRLPGKSVIYNAEDDLEEQSKRLFAICVQYGFDYVQVASQICLLSSEQIDLQITKNDPPELNVEQVTALATACSDPGVVMLGLDPLIELFASDVIDNNAMKSNMALLRAMARRCDISILLSHHTRKPAGNVTIAGDAAASMGASAIVNSARINLTLVTASPADCERYAIEETRRHDFVRLDSAKANLSKRDGEPIWMRREGVHVPGGDDVGVLVAHDMLEDKMGVAAQIGRILLQHMTANGHSTMSLPESAQVVMNADPLCAKLTIAACKIKIETLLMKPISLEEGARIQCRVEKKGAGTVKLVIID